MNILVTGCAGFIGNSVTKKLLERGDLVYGIDNLNDYYDVKLKSARLQRILDHKAFDFYQSDIVNYDIILSLFARHKIDRVIHLAAQAGVRYSLENPFAYIDTNIRGFINILEACRRYSVEHLVYASSSSVYGGNSDMPFAIDDHADHPLSIYAATKKSNELMAHSYSHLYDLPTTGLRFFTVYGPWGRPDMSLFIFTKNIIAGEPIDVFNHGRHRRDFTYIDDIVSGVIDVCDRISKADRQWDSNKPRPDASSAPYRLYNIGSDRPVQLMDCIHMLEDKIGRKARINFLPMQAGDVPATHANIDSLAADTSYQPRFEIKEGICNFVDWYKDYYGVA